MKTAIKDPTIKGGHHGLNESNRWKVDGAGKTKNKKDHCVVKNSLLQP